MIKIINERTLHEVIREMRARGVTLKDTEGFGINMDQSGHTYVVYMGEESEIGVIDTSAGEAGVSGWINPTLDQQAPSNPAGYIEIGEISDTVSYGVENLSNSSGSTWTITLAEASGTQYIKPRTFFVQATNNAPELKDDGLGKVITNDAKRHILGTIDYESGEVTVTYRSGGTPLSAPTVQYDYSELPNSSVFPKVAALSHIVFVTSAKNGHLEYDLYNNNPTNAADPYKAPCFFRHGSSLSPTRIGSSGKYMAEDFCDGRISICLSTDVDDRQKRWMKVTPSNASDIIEAVYVYWNRLSS